jgi:hypothetical protein
VVDWVGVDDRKTFIAGSNFPFEPRNCGAAKAIQIRIIQGSRIESLINESLSQ